MQNETETGYDIFVLTPLMHLKLMKPLDCFIDFMKGFLDKMAIMHWVEREVTQGPYSYKHPEANGLPTYMDIHKAELNQLNEHWHFIQQKVKMFLLVLEIFECNLFINGFGFYIFNKRAFLPMKKKLESSTVFSP